VLRRAYDPIINPPALRVLVINMETNTIEQKQAKWVIEPKQFRHKVTGKIVTQISLMEINQYEEVA